MLTLKGTVILKIICKTLLRRITGQQLDYAKISDMINLSMNYYSVKKTSY